MYLSSAPAWRNLARLMVLYGIVGVKSNISAPPQCWGKRLYPSLKDQSSTAITNRQPVTSKAEDLSSARAKPTFRWMCRGGCYHSVGAGSSPSLELPRRKVQHPSWHYLSLAPSSPTSMGKTKSPSSHLRLTRGISCLKFALFDLEGATWGTVVRGIQMCGLTNTDSTM